MAWMTKVAKLQIEPCARERQVIERLPEAHLCSVTPTYPVFDPRDASTLFFIPPSPAGTGDAAHAIRQHTKSVNACMAPCVARPRPWTAHHTMLGIFQTVYLQLMVPSRPY